MQQQHRPRQPPTIDDRVIAVVGPPCSGKTTYVAEHSKPGDVVVDFDAIARALGSPHEHRHEVPHMKLTLSARQAVVRRFVRLDGDYTLWLIVTSVRQLADVGVQTSRIHVMTTPVDVCLAHADADGRSERVKDVIRTWRP